METPLRSNNRRTYKKHKKITRQKVRRRHNSHNINRNVRPILATCLSTNHKSVRWYSWRIALQLTSAEERLIDDCAEARTRNLQVRLLIPPAPLRRSSTSPSHLINLFVNADELPQSNSVRRSQGGHPGEIIVGPAAALCSVNTITSQLTASDTLSRTLYTSSGTGYLQRFCHNTYNTKVNW